MLRQAGCSAGRRTAACRLATSPATWAASRPTPLIVIEAAEDWKHRPQKNSPGAASTAPRYSTGQPSSPTHRQVDPAEVLPEPGAPHHGRDVHHPLLVDHRPAVAHPGDPAGDPVDSPLGQVRRPDPQPRQRAVVPVLTHGLSPQRVGPLLQVHGAEHDAREDELGQWRRERYGDLAGIRPAEDGRVGGGGVVGDVAPRVGGAHDEHRAVRQLRRTPVVAGVKLPDRRVEPVGEGRHPRGAAEGPGRDHDVVRLDPDAAGGHGIPVPAPLQPLHPRAEPHRQVEGRGIRLEVVGELVLGRVRPARCPVGEPGEAVRPGRGEQAEGVPLVPPPVADAGLAVEDDERPTGPLEVVPGGEAGLAGSDDDGLDVLSAHGWLPGGWRHPPHGCGRRSPPQGRGRRSPPLGRGWRHPPQRPRRRRDAGRSAGSR